MCFQDADVFELALAPLTRRHSGLKITGLYGDQPAVGFELPRTHLGHEALR